MKKMLKQTRGLGLAVVLSAVMLSSVTFTHAQTSAFVASEGLVTDYSELETPNPDPTGCRCPRDPGNP